MHKRKRFGDLLAWTVSLIEGDDGQGGGTGGAGGTDPEGAPNGGQGGDSGGTGGDPAPNTDPAPNGGQGGSEGGKGDGDNGLAPDGKPWKGHARRHEDNYKAERDKRSAAEKDRDAANERLQAVLKAAGVGGEDEPPEKIAERLQAERDAAQAELRTSRIESAVARAARAAGVDPDELLDRRSFAAEVDKLDPTAATFGDDAKGVLDAYLEKFPALKPTPPAEGDGKGKRAPAPPSADLSGGGEKPATGPTSVEDFRKNRAKRRG